MFLSFRSLNKKSLWKKPRLLCKQGIRWAEGRSVLPGGGNEHFQGKVKKIILPKGSWQNITILDLIVG